MSLKNKTKQCFRNIIAMFLAVITVLGIVPIVPIEVSATTNINMDAIGISGWEVLPTTPIIGDVFGGDGSVRIKPQPRVPYVNDILPMHRGYSEEAVVFMNGVRVSSARYVVVIDGVQYEAFCADPHLPGPAQGGIYVPAGEAPALYNVLRYGFRANPYFGCASISEEQRILNAYMTRVAVAMAQHPARSFTGCPYVLAAARHLVDGTHFAPYYRAADFANTLPAIVINGVRHAEDLNRHILEEAPFASSAPFNLTHNVRTNDTHSPFRFEWDASTPAGARLLIDGLTYIAPEVPNRAFAEEPNFTIELPNEDSFIGQQAKIHLVGVHNQHAGRVWRLQHHTTPHAWQDIVFYIPEVHSTAVFSFIRTYDDIPGNGSSNGNGGENGGGNGDTSVRIQKICAITRENIPGALMRLRGMSSHQVVTADGQMWEIDNTGINVSQVLTAGATTAVPSGVTSTVTDGVWTLTGLPYGFFMVEEERAPEGFSMYPQHTAFGFWHLPPNVHIDSPDGLVYNLVERGPNDNHILITFENFPFSEIVVYKREVSNGIGNNQLLVGATFRIQGYYPGNPAIPIDRVATTGADGRVVFSDLPAGHFTIIEIQPPTGYLLGDNNVWSVNIGWGQTVAAGTANSHTFFNVPKSSLEILKVCGVTNEPLEGAVFELYDPTIGERWQATSGANGIAVLGRGSYGNFLYPYRTYILREIVAPTGFILSDGPREVVLSSGDENRVVWRNWRNPGLTIVKQCQDTGERLAGAHFTIVAQGSGRPLPTDFEMITDENGEIRIPWTLFEGESERTFIVTETVPPPGFHLADPNWQVITIQAGYDNTVVFANRRMPDLTIQKTDAITGEAIEGAEFTIERLSPAPVGMVTGNPFRTDANGRIVIPNLAAGVYRIIETRAAAHYWLDPQIANRTWTITIRENEDYLLQVENTLLPTLIITKMNQVTFRPVPMTRFLVEFEVPNSGNVIRIGEFVTDSNGQIILPFVQSGWFRITETRPAPGMSLNVNNSYRVFLSPGQNTYQLLAQMPNLRHNDTPHDGQNNNPHEQVTTPNPIAPEESETQNTSPDWDNIPESDRATFVTGNLQVTGGDAHLTGENIWNFPLNSIVIKKANSVTGELLQGATFEVIHTSAGVSGTMGTVIGRYTTDHSGIIVLTGLVSGSYVVREVIPPTNFTLSVNNSQTVHLMPDGHSVVEVVFDNDPYGGLLIVKTCEMTGIPLANAQFRVVNSSGAIAGTSNGIFTTNQQGEILISNLPPDSYVISEVRAPDGFILNSVPQTIRVNATGQIYRLEFTNAPMATLTIEKVCDNNRPLAGAVFEVRRSSGELISRVATNSSGIAQVGAIEPGTVLITEVQAPVGYMIVEASRTVEIRAGENRVERFVNPKLPTVVIRKLCGDTGVPLQGVVFEIARYFGNGRAGQRLKNYAVDNSYEFITDASGHIYLPTLEHGTWIAIETRPLPGFRNDNPWTTFRVGDNGDTTIIIRNYRYAELTIRKINSVTRAPLEGVHFEISRPDGTRVVNPQTGFHTFITDSRGLIHLPALADGRFYLHETRALPGFLVDYEVIAFNIDSSVRQREHVLTVENTPASGLLIIKTDANTGRPLQGVEFEVRRADGRLVRGLMADENQPNTHANSPNLAPNGNFLTDHRGRIHLNHLEAGVFHVTEVAALPGYILDDTVHVVTITPGRLSTLEVVNVQMAGLRLLKIDSVTRQGIQGVEFRIFDFITNQEVAGPFITDNDGVIDFTGVLPPGRYTIRETREAPGYLRDTMPRTVEFRAGMMTEIKWENTREAGQIQITKLSSADNEVNGLPAGSRLAGAVFEVRDWRTGNVIDQFTTDARGVGVSRPLPLGRYLIEEIVSPAFYKRSDVILDITIEHSGQILRYEFFNEPANVGVEIRKTGPSEVMSGQPIAWTITTIANSSTIELSDFYVRDIFPAHAVRLDRIFTGTFNQSVRYSVMFRTNLNDTWRVAYDNLSSTTNNALVMSPAALGLSSNEFVTEFMFSFGTVRAGFRSVEAPRIEGTVREGLQNGYEFVNRVDVGGKTGSEWVIGNNVWLTRVFRPTHGRHPRTGW